MWQADTQPNFETKPLEVKCLCINPLCYPALYWYIFKALLLKLKRRKSSYIWKKKPPKTSHNELDGSDGQNLKYKENLAYAYYSVLLLIIAKHMKIALLFLLLS